MNRRQFYEEKTLQIGKVMARSGLTPNQLTILSLIPAVISGYFYFTNHELLGALFLLFTLAFDVFDGSVARALDKKTDFGEVLDPSIDRLCEIIILFGIMLSELAESWAAYFCFTGMVMASYIRAKIETKGIPAASIGLMERMQKMTLLLLGSVFVFVYAHSLTIALVIIGGLSYVTSVQRLLYARRNLP